MILKNLPMTYRSNFSLKSMLYGIVHGLTVIFLKSSVAINVLIELNTMVYSYISIDYPHCSLESLEILEFLEILEWENKILLSIYFFISN